jgi:hypothetical protein
MFIRFILVKYKTALKPLSDVIWRQFKWFWELRKIIYPIFKFEKETQTHSLFPRRLFGTIALLPHSSRLTIRSKTHDGRETHHKIRGCVCWGVLVAKV